MENKGSDKEKYSTISISDDEENEEKSFFSKTLEIPKVILSKPKKKKNDYFHQAIRYNPASKEGLNSLQIEERMLHNLTNKQTKALSKSYFKIVCDNIFTFFNVLLITIGIFFISIGDFNDCFFLVIMILNTSIGIIQEVKAKKIVDRLSLINIPEVKVIRDGKKLKIPTDKMVLDDIFFLSSGNEVPCDAFIIENNIEVNESMLTGESLSVKKNVGDYLLAGSFVVSGSCVCRCDRIGEHNYITQLQNKARKVKKVKSILLTSLNSIIKYISAVIIPLGICLAIKNYGVARDYTVVIKKTGASLVTMIPSGLFLLISTALAISVINLSKKKTMVQDSYSIESLARTNILCLDKTGTITDGTMQLEKEIKLSKSRLEIKNIMGSFLGAFEDNNVTSLALNKAYPKNDEYSIKALLPFSSARKFSAVQFEKIGTFILGAPEFITTEEAVLKEAEVYTLSGLRVLLLASCEEDITDEAKFKDVKPFALFVLSDHIREEAYETIKWFNENDVKIKIISGDNPLTVSEIAKKVGVKNSEQYISLDGLTNDEVAQISSQYTVFGRVSPEQKAVLIKSLKNQGNTVAMTGDGVNDILAMKQANCSIAMASGSEAARNSSHIVLMDSNFSNMPQIILEGRKVINNVQRSASLFLMKTIYSVLLALIEIVFWIITKPFESPFSPSHYYILEFLVIGFPSFFLALQPNKMRISGSFNRNVLFKALPGGLSLLLSVCLILIISAIPAFQINNDEIVTLMATLTLSYTGLVILFEICRPFNKYRLTLFMVMLSIAVIYTAFFLLSVSKFTIRFSELNIINWVTIIGVTIISCVFYLLVEYLRYRYNKKHEETDH